MAEPIPEPDAAGQLRGDAGSEKTRVAEAVKAVSADLKARADKARGLGRDEAAEVLEAQVLMASDPGLVDGSAAKLAAGTSAERAVFETFGTFRDMLAAAGGYMAGRVTDLDDIRDRVIAVLTGQPVPGIPESDEPFVLVAEDLAPADTAGIDADTVEAIVTVQGGPTSHTAILARTMGIPAVVAMEEADALAEGTPVLVDGTTGEVVAEPSDEDVAKARTLEAKRAEAAKAATGPAATADGERISVLANIGGPADVENAVKNGAEGVGLYRTEFLFLDRADKPSYAEQVKAYKAVADAFPGQKVVVRTLDAGADKPLPFVSTEEEPNPALGVRGLRLAFKHPELLDEQLRALAEVQSESTADLWAMAPMVADMRDTEYFVDKAREAGLKTNGIMIEVPSAALTAGHLAKVADFFSIGTNDLTQYAYASDRQVGALARYQSPWQPGVLRLIGAAADGAGAEDKVCGVCGEAAADPILACVLVGLGVKSLSMSAPAIPMVKAALALHTVEQCREAADAVLGAVSAEEAKDIARAHLPRLEELGL